MFRRLTSVFKELGPITGTLYVLSSLLTRVFRDVRLYAYEFVVQPVPELQDYGARSGRSRLSVRRIDASDPVMRTLPVPSEVVESRFRQGAHCLGAFRSDEFIGYVWFARDKYEEDEVRCTYTLESAGDSTFDFDLYIFPSYRMGRAFAAIWQGANAYLREQGVTWTFSRISKFNTASLRAHAHLRCRKVSSAVFLVAGPMQLMLAGLRPYIHLSFRPRTRARLVLAAKPPPLISSD